MGSRSHSHQKHGTDSAAANVSPVWRTRGFAPQPQPVAEHALPDLQAMIDHARRYGHSLSKCMAPPSAPPPIQAKLTVGAPDDQYEQEADRVADQVMTMSPPATPGVQRQTEDEESEEIQPKPLAETIPPIVQRQEELEDEEPIQTKCEACEQEEPIQRSPDAVAPTKPARAQPSLLEIPIRNAQTTQPSESAAYVQPKLTIGQPNDQYEQEADKVAEQVMSMAPPATPNIQRQSEDEESEEIQPKPLAGTITPLVQRQEVNLPPVPNYQLTPPSLLTPPSPTAPYQLGGPYPFRLNRQMQATALQYTQQQLTPVTLTPLLSQLSLDALALTPPVGAAGAAPSPTTPPAATPAPTPAPPSPAPAGAQPEAPRAATPGDLLNAVLTMPTIATAIAQLQSQTEQRLRSDWNRLRVGEQVGVVSSLAVVGAGAIAGIIASPDARQLVLSQLNGRVLPVPGINWLRVELNTGPDSLMMGLHLDVGALLPSILGFGPGSSSAIGGPPQPQPYVPGVQRAATAAAAPVPQHDLESRLRQSQGGGSPLPDEVRSFMEPRFGADFSQVRVHTGSEAVQMSQELNAQAFTHKQDVYFGAGKAPGKDPLTAHELTHVVQQTGIVQTKIMPITLAPPKIMRFAQGSTQIVKDDKDVGQYKGGTGHAGMTEEALQGMGLNADGRIPGLGENGCMGGFWISR